MMQDTNFWKGFSIGGLIITVLATVLGWVVSKSLSNLDDTRLAVIATKLVEDNPRRNKRVELLKKEITGEIDAEKLRWEQILIDFEMQPDDYLEENPIGDLTLDVIGNARAYFKTHIPRLLAR